MEGSEIDILNTDIGGIKLKDMTAITFFQWVAKKLNSVPAYNSATVELTALISQPPMTRFYADDEKLRIISKLKKLNVPLP